MVLRAIERKRELLNIQEFGSFQLEINRVLQSAHEALP
jgi:hypothetical protein